MPGGRCRYVKNLERLATRGKFCVLAARTQADEDAPSPFIYIVCSAIGSPIDSRYCEVSPEFVDLTDNYLVVASSSTVYCWVFNDKGSQPFSSAVPVSGGTSSLAAPCCASAPGVTRTMPRGAVPARGRAGARVRQRLQQQAQELAHLPAQQGPDRRHCRSQRLRCGGARLGHRRAVRAPAPIVRSEVGPRLGAWAPRAGCCSPVGKVLVGAQRPQHLPELQLHDAGRYRHERGPDAGGHGEGRRRYRRGR